MWKWIVLQIVAVLLAAAAAQISFNLLQKHLGGKPPAWFDEGCPINAEKGAANCAAVLASPQASVSLWLPLFGKQTYPVAFLGWAYYSMLVVWFIGVGRPTHDRRWWMLIGAALVLAGVCNSIYYLFVMYFKLEHWCLWCLVTHLINFAIAACMFCLWPRKPKEQSVQPMASPPSARPIRPAAIQPRAWHPSWRTIAATVLAMVLTFSLEHRVLQGATRQSELLNAEATAKQYKVLLERFIANSERLARIWDTTDPKPLNIRPEDPVRSSPQPGQLTWDVVLFSDFECPTCKRTAAFIEQTVAPMFGNGLRIIYKHFPINKDCNSSLSSTFHPRACLALQIAEAARLQGGNEAFWRMHDLLFSKQMDGSGLAGLNPEQIAKEAGLDVQRLLNDMNSPAVSQRAADNVADALKCEISGTPYILVNARPIDGLWSKEPGFWDKLADRYWKAAGVPRPESTKLKAAAPTPGTPAPTNAP